MCNWITNQNADIISAWTSIIGTLASLIFGFWIASNLQRKLTSKSIIPPIFKTAS
jgi:hypothetical protein